MLKTLLFIFLGGGIGSVFRFSTSLLTQKYFQSSFPWATFIVNIVGCLLIGAFIGLIERWNWTNHDIRFFLIAGFCGGFTTFSAFGIESLTLFQNNHYLLGAIYILSSVFLGLVAVWLGLFLTK
jgi:fluoride exporter